MKSIRTYLIVVSVLLFLSLLAGIYVWYVYQTMQSPIPESNSVPAHGEESPKEVVSLTLPIEERVVSEEGVKEPVPSSAVTIDTTTLTVTQRSILASLGYKGDTVTISTAAITCAEESVGELRFTEILNGAAPTPFELFALSPCLKK